MSKPLGTPSSGTLTGCIGLPIATGVSGLGTNVSTFLATPSSANLAVAVTDETGSGSLVFGTSPTLVTPALGTPASGTLTNCTGLPQAGVVGLTIADSPVFATVKLSGLTDDYIPYHVNDSTGLANGPTKTAVDSAISASHARSHALDGTSDHTIGSLTSTYLVKSDGSKLVPATNTDTQVSGIVTALTGINTTVADDAVYSWTLGYTSAILLINGGTGSLATSVHVIPGTPTCGALGTVNATVQNLSADFNANVGVLAGTTGVDGKVTVSAHTDGKIYIENRSGGTINLNVSVLAADPL